MLFYRIVAAKDMETATVCEEQVSRRERLVKANQVRLDTEAFNQVLKSGLLFVSDITEMKKMIGLTEAKKVIGEALSYYKAQKLFAEKGLQSDHPAMHMGVFR